MAKAGFIETNGIVSTIGQGIMTPPLCLTVAHFLMYDIRFILLQLCDSLY